MNILKKPLIIVTFIVIAGILSIAFSTDNLKFKISWFKWANDEQILIGVLNPYSNKEKLNKLLEKKINCFSLELLPRITRAQSMDILSSIWQVIKQ